MLTLVSLGLGTQPFLVLDPSSDWELAYDYERDACPNINPREGIRGDQPDSMPIAWFNRELNRSSLIAATSQGVHASVAGGATLDELRHDCSRVVFNSSFGTSPTSFANRQWLQSVRLLPNGTAFGLVHNEFKGEFSGNTSYCSCVINATHRDPDCANHCELWSTGLAISHDGGEHFELAADPPGHLVAALPSRFAKDQQLAGYGAISTMLPGSDGAFYGLINVAGASQQQAGVPAGNCVFRTESLANPHAYRALGADGAFSVRWRDPYTSGSDGAGRCATIPTNATSPLAPHVCIRRIVPGSSSSRYVALGDHSGAVRYAFSEKPDFEDALLSWGPPRLLEMAGLSRWVTPTGSAHVLYPVLLDHRSPDMGDAHGDPGNGDNYALTSLDSSTLFLYIVASGRNVLRRRVLFSDLPPSPPAPPPPPPPADCQALRVSGSGARTADGVYARTERTSSGAPVFAKDATHQIYRTNVTGAADGLAWHLGDEGVAGSVLYVNVGPSAPLMPPAAGWQLGPDQSVGTPPAPAGVVCTPARARSRDW